MGTIDALVRATIKIYYIGNNLKPADDPSNQPVVFISETTPTVPGFIQLSTDAWVRDFPVDTVASGQMFYSEKVSPYKNRVPQADGSVIEETVTANNLPIINSITVSPAQIDTVFYVSVTLDAVAYDGNIYKKIENGETDEDNIPVYALPFGKKESLPADWEAWK